VRRVPPTSNRRSILLVCRRPRLILTPCPWRANEQRATFKAPSYQPISGDGNAIGRVRPCVSTLFLNQLNIILYACADHDHSSPEIESQGHRVRLKVSAKCVYYTSIYCGFLWVLIHGRSSRFPLWRYQLPVSAARRAAWRGRGWRQRRSSACVSEVALSVTP